MEIITEDGECGGWSAGKLGQEEPYCSGSRKAAFIESPVNYGMLRK